MPHSSTVLTEPDWGYLSDSLLREFHDHLIVERAVELTKVGEHRATVSLLTGQSDVDSILEREMAEVAARRSDEAIADIDRALALLDAGLYGSCERCESRIAIERLDVIPQARLCARCSGSRVGLLG